MEIKGHTVRVDDEVWAWLNDLPGKTLNDSLQLVMFEMAKWGLAKMNPKREEAPATAPAVDLSGVNRRLDWMTDKLDELLEIAQTVPQQPASVPGVQMGAGSLRPRRETGTERAERERLERQQRAESLDSVSDPSIDRSDEFVSV